jgi:hypothetical protein
MLIEIPPLQEFFFGTRVLEAVFFTVLGLIIYNRYRGTPLKDRPFLHVLFLLANFGWTIFMWMDAIIFTFGAVSFTIGPEELIVGYNLEYTSLLLSNIFRDIAMIGVMIEVFSLLLMGDVIKNGEQSTKKKIRDPKFIILAISISLFVIINDTISIERYPSRVRVVAQGNFSSIFTLLIPVLIYLYASFKISRILREIQKNPETKTDKNYITQLRLLEWGIFLKGLSNLWLIVMNFVHQIFDLATIFGSFELAYSVVSIVKHVLYLIAPLFIYLSLKKQNNALLNRNEAPRENTLGDEEVSDKDKK